MGIVLEGYDSEYYKVNFKMTSNRTIEAKILFSETILSSSSSNAVSSSSNTRRRLSSSSSSG